MLEIRGLHKSFAQNNRAQIFWALQDINLSIVKGEFLTWLGPSGCGKTTLLRCLSGFESPNRGDIILNGDSILTMPPQKRPFHMVFQRYALFPHMTVWENIEFALITKETKLDVRKKRVQHLLEMMGLENLHHQKPGTLSGGQSQRVALARALADQPEILLLDEPLSALDEKIRGHLRQELKELQRQVGITFIFVTHDQQEAFQISDRIAVFHEGRLHQVGSSLEIYRKPKSEFVAQFIGDKNKVPGLGFVYPEDVSISPVGDSKFKARIVAIEFVGREFEIRIQLEETKEVWKVFSNSEMAQNLSLHQMIEVGFDQKNLIQVQSK